MNESLIKKRMNSVLKDSQLTEAQKESFASALRENGYRCVQQANRSYLVFLGLSTAFTLIISAQVNRVTILGVDFSKDNLAILLLPVSASFFLYRASCLNQLGLIVDRALETYYEVTRRSIFTEKLHELLRFPSITEAEEALHRIVKRSSFVEKSGLIWLVLLYIFLLLMPLIWVGMMIWWLITASQFSMSWKILATATILFFACRAIWVIAQTRAYSREGLSARY